MSPATKRTRTPTKKKKAAPGLIQVIWPLIAGVVVTPFAIWGASVLAMRGPESLRLLYPYVVLVQGHAEHFATSQEETLSQWVMYAQFPLYGLIWMVAARFIRGASGALSLVLVHCGGVAAAILNGTT